MCSTTFLIVCIAITQFLGYCIWLIIVAIESYQKLYVEKINIVIQLLSQVKIPLNVLYSDIVKNMKRFYRNLNIYLVILMKMAV